MGSDSRTWPTIAWGEICHLKYGKSLKGYRNENGSVPVYGTNGQVGWCETPLSKTAGVVIGRKGAYRGIHYSDKPFYVIDTAFYLEPKIDFNIKWAYYSLLTQDINGLDSGSAIPSTRKEDFYALRTQLPPRAAQDEIVQILDSFERKIELNRQSNQTLESMAQALFKSWFVDFDPVIDNALAAGNEIPEPLAAKAAARRALQEQGTDKANQRHTLPDHIRQLFPSRFQFTEELGWIPEGWEVKFFGDIAQHVRQGVAASDIGPNEVYVGLEHVERKHLFLEKSGRGSDVESNKTAFRKGDLLFGKLRPYFHKVAMPDSKGVCSTDILVFRAKNEFYRSFMVLTANREDFVAHANACSTGTRMPRASAKDMLAYEIVFPPIDVLRQFEGVVAPMWKKGQINLSASKKLAEVRDALLPKLLSGELRIPEAEQAAEEMLA